MIPVSQEFHDSIKANMPMEVRALVYFPLKPWLQPLTLTGDDFMEGGISFTESVSDMLKLEFGRVCIGSCNLLLNNWDGRFDAVDFDGARIILTFGVTKVGGGKEFFNKPQYTLEQQRFFGDVIQLTGYDDLYRLTNIRWSESGALVLREHAVNTIDMLMWSANEVTGEPFGYKSLEDIWPFPSYRLGDLPESLWDESVATFFSNAANMVGCNIKQRRDDGYATIEPFVKHSEADYVHTFDIASTVAIGRVSMTITGANVHLHGVTGISDDIGAFHQPVTNGYYVDITENPLPTNVGLAGDGEPPQYTYLQTLLDNVSGRTFRAFEVNALGDPSLEAGDPVRVMDSKGNLYDSYITNMTYVYGGFSQYSCGIEMEAEGKGISSTPYTSTYMSTIRMSTEMSIGNLLSNIFPIGAIYRTTETDVTATTIGTRLGGSWVEVAGEKFQAVQLSAAGQELVLDGAGSVPERGANVSLWTDTGAAGLNQTFHHKVTYHQGGTAYQKLVREFIRVS